jgi:hypothetical protein
VRSLEARVKRLEKKRRIADTPSRRAYDDASFRNIGRYAYSAKLKLFRIAGQDEDDLWEFLSERERRCLEKDTPEVASKGQGCDRAG